MSMSVISVIRGLTRLTNPHYLLNKRVKKWTCDERPLCDVTHSHWLFLPFLTGSLQKLDNSYIIVYTFNKTMT